MFVVEFKNKISKKYGYLHSVTIIGNRSSLIKESNFPVGKDTDIEEAGQNVFLCRALNKFFGYDKFSDSKITAEIIKQLSEEYYVNVFPEKEKTTYWYVTERKDIL